MATITTDTYLDTATANGYGARTAGEAWTIQGCTLTIRTDTRWYSGAPASMTGSLSGPVITAALGGRIHFDATNVRWLAFDTGTGTVPAIGTTITQGGVSGYLLGVWQDYVSAPTAVGAAMPSTGYLKFRETSGGTFSAGALTGIGANASSPDVLGWIEIVFDASVYIALSPLGAGLTSQGGWFYLGTTTGSPNQVLQLPTNGGGSGTVLLGVQIETSPGSGTYEWYPALNSSQFTAAILATDQRAKYLYASTNGQAIIGSNGTTNIGYTPVAGCKIRVPNIFLRNCATATRAQNIALTANSTNRAQFNTGSGGGKINLSNVMSTMFHSHYTPTSIQFTDSIYDGNFTLSQTLEASTFTNVANSNVTAWTTGAFSITRANNVSVTNCKFSSCGTTVPVQFSTGTTFTLSNVLAFMPIAKASLIALSFTGVTGVTATNTGAYGGYVSFSTNTANITFTNTDYISNMSGNTTTTVSDYVFGYSGTVGQITISGLTFGLNGTLSQCHPYGYILNSSGVNYGQIDLRNIGTIQNPLSTGNNATTYTASIVNLSTTGDSNIRIKRVYLTNLRTAAFTTGSGASLTNIIVQNVGGARSATTGALYLSNSTIKGILGTSSGVSSTFQNGTYWQDCFTSLTAGKLIFSADNMAAGSPYTTLSVANPNISGFNNNGQLYLKSVGDFFIVEMPSFFIGHTGFQNTAFTFTGTNQSNHTFEYQIDTGSGWNGTWKTLSAANISAETVTYSIGFKLKIRITCTVANSANAVQYISIPTNSSQVAQESSLYPLDTANLSFTGLATGSEVRCYTGALGSGVEIGGIESTSGSTFSFQHSSGGSSGYIMILALGYQPIYIPYTYKSTDDTILIQPVIDRNFVA